MGRQLRLYRVTESERKVSICAACRGFKKLCGRPVCPILIKYRSLLELKSAGLNRAIFGACPPSVFVGSWGYPRVLAGPLTPFMYEEEAAIMDSPDMWLNLSVEDILRYRLSLVRGKRAVGVHEARDPSRDLSVIQELAMSASPVDVEMTLSKRPSLRVRFFIRDPPFGPSAPLRGVLMAENPYVPRKVDYVVSDTDLRAEEAAWVLYKDGLSTRHIVRLLSVGLLGTGRRRRLVPTEWSITAVDDALGRRLLSKVRENPPINHFYVFGREALGNNIQILLIPHVWMFEVLEAWLIGKQVEPEGDYELWSGRKRYASNIAGAYYAARLPVLEYLEGIRRQAAAVVFLEVYPEWVPLGVWRVREICRDALRGRGRRFSSLKETLEELGKRLKLPLERWLSKSRIIGFLRKQRRLTLQEWH